jgi:hypothetical protein
MRFSPRLELLLSPDLTIVDVSDAFIQAMQVPRPACGRAQLLGAQYRALALVPDRERHVLVESAARVLLEGQADTVLLKLEDPSQAATKQWRVTSWPIVEPVGPPHLRWIQQEWQDESRTAGQNVEAEARVLALQLASSTAEAASRAQSAFLSNVSS